MSHGKQSAQPSDDVLMELAGLRTILDDVGAYIYTKDRQGRYTYANRYVQELFGASLEHIVGRDDRDFFDLTLSNQLKANDALVMEQGMTIEQEEVNYVMPTREERIYWTVKKPIRDASGEIVGMCGISTDITELYQLKEQLRRQSTLDELTGLYNRRHFFEALDKELGRARRQNSPTALLLMDVDFFKAINDAYGHPAGDRVLTCLGQTLLQNVRSEDTVARVGGEEFAVLLPNTDIEAAEALAERIRNAVASEGICCPQGKHVTVTLSIGLAQSSAGEGTVDELYCLADRLLYQAKQQGRNRVCMAA